MAKRKVTKLTKQGRWKARFVQAIATGGTITEAAAAAGIARPYFYKALEKDQDFATRYNDALQQRGDLLEAQAIKLAMGVDDLVLHDGQVVFAKFDRQGNPLPDDTKARGARRKPVLRKVYFPTVVMRMLASHKPELYAEKLAVNGSTPRPISPGDTIAALDHVIERLNGEAPVQSPPTPEQP